MRKLSVLIVVLAVVAVACSSSGSAVIASVGGTDITEGDIGALFESNSIPMDESFRSTLFAVIAREVLLQGFVADFGVDVDEAEVETVVAGFTAQMEEAGATPEDFLGVPDASTEMVRFNAEMSVIRQQAIDLLIQLPEAMSAFFSEPLAFTRVCVRHILVETVEEAEAVLARLEGGADFAEVATEVSLDTGTPGGNLGCSTASRYVTEFAEATMVADVGALFGPVETSFGFHVLVVDDRSAPTEEEVKADPRAYITDTEVNGLWTDWFNEKLRVASVTVDEEYGFWSPVGILRPDQEHLAPDQG